MANQEIRAEQHINKDGSKHAQVVAYSAPLPPASEFEKYESVLPGAADRIIKLAENQNRHRRFIEKVVVIFDSIKSFGGLVSALIITLAGIGGGIFLILNDKSAQGLTSILTPLGLIAASFIYQQSKKKDQ